MAELSELKNIGKEMASKLASVELDTAEKLINIGSKEAFFRLKTKYPQICLVHLYALEGAVQNIDFNCLSEATKKDLKAFSDSLK
ncbi:MAG: TfoX/Sxy family protein [Clostridia bacterium]|nr:TfoX/Sxy family protein [Clostridia bacterium]